jgi:hypothetical protein
MVLHAALAQQHVADKQVTLEHAALVVRKRRRGNREPGLQGVHQCLGHGSDVALRRAIEGGAVLEIDLLHTLRLQPAQCVQRLRHGLDGAMVRDFSATTTASMSASNGACGYADGLHRAHARAHQVVGQVCGTGKVVCNAAQKCACHGVSNEEG